MKMRIPILISLLLLVCSLSAQQNNIHYRTVTDSNLALHFLVFSGDSQCRVIFPLTTSAEAMMRKYEEFEVKYRVINDTLSLYDLPDTDYPIMEQLEAARFVLQDDQTLFDCISGYTYFDKQAVKHHKVLYVLDDTAVKQRLRFIKTYTSGGKSYKQGPRVRRFVKRNSQDIESIHILKGKKAFNTYGLDGVNGVIKIVMKE